MRDKESVRSQMGFKRERAWCAARDAISSAAAIFCMVNRRVRNETIGEARTTICRQVFGRVTSQMQDRRRA